MCVVYSFCTSIVEGKLTKPYICTWNYCWWNVRWNCWRKG